MMLKRLKAGNNADSAADNTPHSRCPFPGITLEKRKRGRLACETLFNTNYIYTVNRNGQILSGPIGRIKLEQKNSLEL